MAQFRWMGEPARQGLTYIATTKLTIASKTGPQLLTPVPPATEFVIGADIGYPITDPVSILVLTTDPRFQRIS